MNLGGGPGADVLTAYLRILSGFSRDGRLYLLASALLGLTYWGGIASVLANLYLLRLGYGPEFIGLFNACGGFGYASFALPAGAVGRRWGSRRAMIAGLWVSVAGGLLLPMAEAAPEGLRSALLLVGHITLTAGFSLFAVNGSPFLVVATTPEERNHAFSVSAALGPFSAFVGSLSAGVLPGLFAPALGITLAHPAPYRYPLFIAAALLIPACMAILATRPASEEPMAQLRGGTGRAPRALIALLALAVALRTPAEGSARTFFNVYLDAGLGAPTPLIGALTATGQLLSGPVALAAPLLMARYGVSRTYLLGSAGAVLGLMPLALIPHWAGAGVGFVGTMAAISLAFPSVNVYAMALVAPAWRSTMSGALALATGTSFMLVALSGGYLISAFGFPSLYLTAASLAAVGTALFWAYFRMPRGETALAS